MKPTMRLFPAHSLLFVFMTHMAAGATLDSPDLFGPGDNGGWVSGGPNPNPPAIVNDGGPSGAGDGYLRITSTGSLGPGGRLVVFNKSTDWNGDFTAAGAGVIGMDLNNLGDTALQMRISLATSSGTLNSTQAVSLAAGSGWQSVEFSLSPSDLTGTGSLATVNEVRLLHVTSPGRIGTPVAAELGMDNPTLSAVESQTVSVSGRIRHAGSLQPIPGVRVVGNQTAETFENQSDASGQFALQIPASGSGLDITANKQKDNPASNGVSTLDILLIRRHVLDPVSESSKLGSPRQFLAADVSGDQRITTLDILLIRRLILNPVQFDYYVSGEDVWRFYPESHVFLNPDQPWTEDFTLRLDGVDEDQTGRDFLGVKLGDVDGSWSAP